MLPRNCCDDEGRPEFEDDVDDPAVMPLSCCFRGLVTAGEAGRMGSEGEHGERDEGLVSVEPECNAREESDLGVG